MEEPECCCKSGVLIRDPSTSAEAGEALRGNRTEQFGEECASIVRPGGGVSALPATLAINCIKAVQVHATMVQDEFDAAPELPKDGEDAWLCGGAKHGGECCETAMKEGEGEDYQKEIDERKKRKMEKEEERGANSKLTTETKKAVSVDAVEEDGSERAPEEKECEEWEELSNEHDCKQATKQSCGYLNGAIVSVFVIALVVVCVMLNDIPEVIMQVRLSLSLPPLCLPSTVRP